MGSSSFFHIWFVEFFTGKHTWKQQEICPIPLVGIYQTRAVWIFFKLEKFVFRLIHLLK